MCARNANILILRRLLRCWLTIIYEVESFICFSFIAFIINFDDLHLLVVFFLSVSVLPRSAILRHKTRAHFSSQSACIDTQLSG